jgi:DNA-directed RNA polymerase specialized sigma24 family protein
MPLGRLRTYPSEILARVAQNRRDWWPLVTALTEPSARRVLVAPDQWQQLLASVAELLARTVPGAHGPVVEEAIQDTLLKIIRGGDTATRAYCYETPYPLWLAQAAHLRLRGHWRRQAREQALTVSLEAFQGDIGLSAGFGEKEPTIAENPTPNDPTHDETYAAQRELDWQSRFELVIGYFRPGGRCRVKAIWAQALLSGSIPDDNALKRYIIEKCGEDVPVTTLAVTRYRLRQRLAVLQLLRDQQDGRGTMLGDSTLLGRLKISRWGLAPKDVPTVRALAGWARVCAPDPTFGWAVFTHVLLDGSEYSADQVLARTHAFLQGVPGYPERMLGLVRGWQADGRRRTRWKAVRRQTWAAGMDFLAEPTWFLTVVRCLPAAEVVAVLMPDPTERIGDEVDQVHTIVAALAEEPV